MRKIFVVIFLSSLLLASCGRKGPLTYEGTRHQPDFTNYSDELEASKLKKVSETSEELTDPSTDKNQTKPNSAKK